MPVLIALAAGAGLFGVVTQDDAHPPQPWRPFTPDEAQAFDLGHAVFNTQWTPAGEPAGRRDGIGPLFSDGGRRASDRPLRHLMSWIATL